MSIVTKNRTNVYFRAFGELNEYGESEHERAVINYLIIKGIGAHQYFDRDPGSYEQFEKMLSTLRRGDWVLYSPKNLLSFGPNVQEFFRTHVDEKLATPLIMDDVLVYRDWGTEKPKLLPTEDLEALLSRARIQGLGNPKFGVTSNKRDGYQIKPDELAVVEDIRQLRKDNPKLGITRFCELLDEKGVKIRNSKKAHSSTVKNIFQYYDIQPPFEVRKRDPPIPKTEIFGKRINYPTNNTNVERQ